MGTNNNNDIYSIHVGDKSYIACDGGFAATYKEKADSKDASSDDDAYSASFSYPSENESKQCDDESV